MKNIKKIRGFTLIEMIISVAIVLVFITLIVTPLVGYEASKGVVDSVEQKYFDDPDKCFDEFKVEEARRDSSGQLYCKVDGKWETSYSD